MMIILVFNPKPVSNLKFKRLKDAMSSPATFTWIPPGNYAHLVLIQLQFPFVFICFKGEKGEVGMRRRGGNTGIKVLFLFFIYLFIHSFIHLFTFLFVFILLNLLLFF